MILEILVVVSVISFLIIAYMDIMSKILNTLFRNREFKESVALFGAIPVIMVNTVNRFMPTQYVQIRVSLLILSMLLVTYQGYCLISNMRSER